MGLNIENYLVKEVDLTNNNNNLKRELNIHSFNLESKNKESYNKNKILISNKKKNINDYFEDSFEEKIKYDNKRMREGTGKKNK